MENLWTRLNSLVPSPNCRTWDNEIIEWSDARPQPNDTELLAVDVDAIEAAELAVKQETAGELTNSPLTGITYAQADNKIDTIFSGITTVAALRVACVTAFKLVARLLIAIAKKQGLSG